MKRLLFTFLLFLPLFSSGQIIPAGLGEHHMASWLAFGIKQKLDTLQDLGWQSTTYIATGRMSRPDNRSPLSREGLWVINQEFYNQFRPDWEYSFAFSYRRQNLYQKEAPYNKKDPGMKQEFRIYGRFSYFFQTPFMTITPTLRQEFQKYYDPDFNNYPESLQIRSRLRLKFSIPLVPDESHRLLLYSEQLFSTSYLSQTKNWTDFKYTDSRFSIYYSYAPQNIPFTFNLGYMNDLIGKSSPSSTSYLAFDLIWENPFS